MSASDVYTRGYVKVSAKETSWHMACTYKKVNDLIQPAEQPRICESIAEL
jgi:hypothetical protein